MGTRVAIVFPQPSSVWRGSFHRSVQLSALSLLAGIGHQIFEPGWELHQRTPLLVARFKSGARCVFCRRIGNSELRYHVTWILATNQRKRVIFFVSTYSPASKR